VIDKQTSNPEAASFDECLARMTACVPWSQRKHLIDDPPAETGNGRKAKKGKPSKKHDRAKQADDAPPEQASHDNSDANGVMADMKGSEMPTREAFDELVRKSDRGDKQATLQLRQILDSNPGIWQQAGDLAAHAELSLIRKIAKDSGLETGMFLRYINDLTQQLAGTSSTPLERLAARRVVQTWAWAQYVDMVVAANNDMPLPEAKYWASRQDAAQRRWVSSMKMLTAIRTLLPGQPAGSVPVPKLTADAAPSTKAPTNDEIEKKTDAEPATKPINRMNGNGRPVPSALIPRPRRRTATPCGAT